MEYFQVVELFVGQVIIVLMIEFVLFQVDGFYNGVWVYLKVRVGSVQVNVVDQGIYQGGVVLFGDVVEKDVDIVNMILLMYCIFCGGQDFQLECCLLFFDCGICIKGCKVIVEKVGIIVVVQVVGNVFLFLIVQLFVNCRFWFQVVVGGYGVQDVVYCGVFIGKYNSIYLVLFIGGDVVGNVYFFVFDQWVRIDFGIEVVFVLQVVLYRLFGGFMQGWIVNCWGFVDYLLQQLVKFGCIVGLVGDNVKLFLWYEKELVVFGLFV